MADEVKRASRGKFAPGQSGNPAGRPKSASVELRRQLADHGPAMVNKAVEMALAGDAQALKICLDRIAPPLKPSAAPISIDLEGAEGLAGVSRRLVDEAAAGRVPADVAAQLVGALGQVAKTSEMDDVERRIAALEQATP